MARYEHLPIYKQAMDVAVWFEQTVMHFSRYHKYTLGSDLRKQSRKIVALIVKANGAPQKSPYLLQLRAELDELLILVRLAKECKAFRGFSAYEHCVKQIVSLCKQNEGWLKSQTS